MPWAGILYPTTDQKLLDMIKGKDKSVRYLNKQWYKTSPDIVKLAQFIIDHRTKMKFRLQQKYAIFYSDKKLAQELIETFCIDKKINAIVSPEFDKKNNTPLPHEISKYQSMITVKIEEWNTNIKNN